MKIKYLLAASVVSLSAAATIATPAAAQQITSGIEGSVTDESGMALPGATVTVTNTRTGAVRTSTTGSNGSFRETSLPPGGPYTVTVTAPGYEGQTVEDVFTNISGNTGFAFALTSTAAGSDDNVIVVTGARAAVTQLAVGPGTAFGSETLEAFPSITRDVRDIIRIDPRVSLDRSNEVDRISCLGGNDRSNTFTVDGIVQADVFGLNGTPFAARNSLPLPFDVIEQTSVEFAPFDVEYSEFTGCLVNVVTKAGTNELHGSAFYTYFDGGLFANSIDGNPLNAGREKRWGATLNGPIIPDRLFFSFGYEETDLGSGNNFGPAGAGFTNEADFVTQDQFDQFASIAQSVYGQDIGGYPAELAESSVRYFGRLDAQITDNHRIEGTYQRLEETNIESDFGGQNLTGFNSFEDEGTISDYYSFRWYGDWSDTISTELRVSRAEVGDVQGPVGFGEAQSDDPTIRLAVLVEPVAGITDENGILSTGPGIFRSANQLDTRTDQARFQMNIDAGDGHYFKLGAEVNDLEVFNLFAINATGTIFFNSLADFQEGLVAPGFFSSVFGGADDLAAGELGGATIASAQGGDINNAAALFGRTIYSVYAQDEWQATDQLTINAGVRVQLYDGDAPQFNQNFVDRYGFSNAVPFSSLDAVVLPRLSASYDFDNEGFFNSSRVTGGVGVFTGGDPVVYFSNAFSNNGFSSANGDTFDCDASQLTTDANTGQIDVVTGGSFTGIPQCAIDEAVSVAEQGGNDIQSTDPNFEVPTVVRANLGFQTEFGTETGFFSNWRLNLDYIYSHFRNTLNFVDLSQTVNADLGLNGFTVDGRPLYQALDVTNTGCNATLDGTGGTGPTYSGLTSDCFGTGRDDNIQLTNGRSYDSNVFSAILTKRFDGGLFTDGGSTNFNLGYAFTDSNNFRNVGSSTATSSFDVSAAFDRQNPANSTSNFENKHNITMSFSFREEFFEGYDTGIGIFFRARSGRPYSLTFDGGGDFIDSSSGNDNALLYIPTGVGDANLSDFSGFNLSATQLAAVQATQDSAVSALGDYLATSQVGSECNFTPGASISRNTCNNDWFFDLDLRFSQELPFLGALTGLKQDKLNLYVDFENFLNMVDSSWNILRSRGEFIDLVEAGLNIDDPDSADPDDRLNIPAFDDQGRYVISGFNPDDDNDILISSSAWRIQLGVRYEF